jgi:hypothetical protein
MHDHDVVAPQVHCLARDVTCSFSAVMDALGTRPYLAFVVVCVCVSVPCADYFDTACVIPMCASS